MFISSNEKQSLTLRITVLEDRVNQLARSLNALHNAKTMSSDGSKPRPVKKTKEEKIQAQRAYARKYYARKRAEKIREKS